MSKTSILLLIIYTLFSLEVTSQNFQLKIVGNDDSETTIIDSLNYEKYHLDYNAMEQEVDSMQNKLFKNGFIENEIDKFIKKNDSVYLATIHLKNKYNTIFIYYNSESIPKSILEDLSIKVFDDYFILPFQNIETTLYNINSRISDLGFPFSEIQLNDIKVKDSKTLQASLLSNENTKKRTIDKIILNGYEKFPKSYLKHYLKIKPEKIFNLTEVKNKTKALNELRFANQIKDPEVLFTKDSTILYLYLDKTKSNYFDGYLGFGTNEKTNKIDFNGYLNLELTNNLNSGETFNLIYKSDENEQKTFNAKLNLPYLFNSPLGVEVGLKIFKRDSSFTTVNQEAKLFYQLNPQSNIFVGINSTDSNNLLDEENSIIEIQDYKSNSYNARYVFRKSQFKRLFNTNFLFDIELGNGKRRYLNTSENQTYFVFNTFKIFNLNKKNSAYVRLNGSGLFSDSYLENELYRFGGINSIRGYEENSIVASLYGLINTEYRYQLSNSLYVHSIIDFAYLENKLIVQKERLYGFGFGFGLLTKAGLLKFNYANGKSENQKFKFSNSKIHLSLKAVF